MGSNSQEPVRPTLVLTLVIIAHMTTSTFPLQLGLLPETSHVGHQIFINLDLRNMLSACDEGSVNSKPNSKFQYEAIVASIH